MDISQNRPKIWNLHQKLHLITKKVPIKVFDSNLIWTGQENHRKKPYFPKKKLMVTLAKLNFIIDPDVTLCADSENMLGFVVRFLVLEILKYGLILTQIFRPKISPKVKTDPIFLLSSTRSFIITIWFLSSYYRSLSGV